MRIAAGDYVSWNKSATNYPAPNWGMTYVLRKKNKVYSFNANANGSGFTVTLDSTTTSAWEPGVYAIGAFVTQSGEQVQVKCSFPRLTVTPNLASGSNTGPRGIETETFAEKALAAAEATYLALVSRKVASAQVNGNAYTLANLSELRREIERLRSEVRREHARDRLNGGLGASNKVGVRFRPLGLQGYPPQIRVPWQ